MYGDEPVVIVGEIAVAVGALRFRWVITARMVVGQRIIECESHNHTAFGGIRDREAVCVPKHESDSRLGMWIHAAHRLGLGGDRRRSCTAESRSTTRMVPPQRGQFHSE